MFEIADDFFASMNQSRVPQSFWENSIIEKPADREMLCHAFAFDFSNGKDFRWELFCNEYMTAKKNPYLAILLN